MKQIKIRKKKRNQNKQVIKEVKIEVQVGYMSMLSL